MTIGPLIVMVVETETEGSSTLVAVMVYVPATFGDVHMFPLKVPTLAVQVRPSVAPPVATAVKPTRPGATVCFAGEIGEITTLVGVTTQVVETTLPFESVTVSVYVLAEVNGGVAYETPFAAEVVISELPTPVEPITAVPSEKVGTSITDELYGGVDELGTRLLASGD
jgi:hypothetical protein